jgi:hypothetical protein
LLPEKEAVVDGLASRVSRVLVTGPLAPFADAYRAQLRGLGSKAIDRTKPLAAKPGRYQPPDPLLAFLEAL